MFKSGLKDALLWLAAFVLLSIPGSPQAQIISDKGKVFEEIVVSFEVPKLVREDIFVQYDGSTVYLPLTTVFTLLDINIEADRAKKIFTGFYISREHPYEFDMTNFRIKVNGKEHPYLASEYYYDDRDLYLRVDVFEALFGLELTFDFTLLRVFLPLKKELPAYQKLQRRLAREKLKKEEAMLKDVVNLQNRREYFDGGSMDWVLSTNPVGGRNKHYYDLDYGGILLGGDFRIGLGGDNEDYFNSRQFDYHWHYYVNDNPYLTQLELGRVNGGGSLSRTVEGGLATNRPQVRRKYFQTINISEYIGEGWEAELYVDNKLVDYMVTDQSGFYHFTTDVFYGASNLNVKLYGPNGELRTDEKIIRVPYNLIPKGETEYTVSGGEATVNGEKRIYSQANVYYGITSSFTAGLNADVPVAGVEEKKPLGAVDATYQLYSNMTFNGSYAPDYAYKARFNFSAPSIVNLNAGFSGFAENIERNPIRQIYNVNFAASSPLRLGRRYLGLRYYISWDKYESFSAINMNYGFNLNVHPFYLTYIGQYKDTKLEARELKNLTSQVLLSTQLMRLIRPQFRVDYDHTNKEISKYGMYLAKRVFRTGQVSLSAERNVITKSSTIMLTINFLSPFAEVTNRTVRTGGNYTMNQLQRGSIRYDSDARGFYFDRRTSVGTGSAVVRPFLDENYNGVMDGDEEYLEGLRAKIGGARMQVKGNDRRYFYEGLRPYEDYTVQIDPYSLDNPLLKPTHENYQIKVNPNVVTSIEVPLITASEISGKVERKTADVTSGIGGFRVILMNLSKETLIELPTFNSGEFYFLGLIPGSYKAYIEPKQLSQYGYRSEPEFINFEIKPVSGGTSVGNINFLLVPKDEPLSGSGK